MEHFNVPHSVPTKRPRSLFREIKLKERKVLDHRTSDGESAGTSGLSQSEDDILAVHHLHVNSVHNIFLLGGKGGRPVAYSDPMARYGSPPGNYEGPAGSYGGPAGSYRVHPGSYPEPSSFYQTPKYDYVARKKGLYNRDGNYQRPTYTEPFSYSKTPQKTQECRIESGSVATPQSQSERNNDSDGSHHGGNHGNRPSHFIASNEAMATESSSIRELESETFKVASVPRAVSGVQVAAPQSLLPENETTAISEQMEAEDSVASHLESVQPESQPVNNSPIATSAHKRHSGEFSSELLRTLTQHPTNIATASTTMAGVATTTISTTTATLQSTNNSTAPPFIYQTRPEFENPYLPISHMSQMTPSSVMTVNPLTFQQVGPVHNAPGHIPQKVVDKTTRAQLSEKLKFKLEQTKAAEKQPDKKASDAEFQSFTQKLKSQSNSIGAAASQQNGMVWGLGATSVIPTGQNPQMEVRMSVIQSVKSYTEIRTEQLPMDTSTGTECTKLPGTSSMPSTLPSPHTLPTLVPTAPSTTLPATVPTMIPSALPNALHSIDFSHGQVVQTPNGLAYLTPMIVGEKAPQQAAGLMQPVNTNGMPMVLPVGPVVQSSVCGNNTGRQPRDGNNVQFVQVQRGMAPQPVVVQYQLHHQQQQQQFQQKQQPNSLQQFQQQNIQHIQQTQQQKGFQQNNHDHIQSQNNLMVQLQQQQPSQQLQPPQQQSHQQLLPESRRHSSQIALQVPSALSPHGAYPIMPSGVGETCAMTTVSTSVHAPTAANTPRTSDGILSGATTGAADTTSAPVTTGAPSTTPTSSADLGMSELRGEGIVLDPVSGIPGMCIQTVTENGQIELDRKDIVDGMMLCLICEDRATGLHYGIVTCEGCKGFFKRTVQNKRVYTCTAGEDCEVIKSQRNRCQYCRFKKCMQKGMVVAAVREDRMPGGRNSGAVYNMFKFKYKRHRRKSSSRESGSRRHPSSEASCGSASDRASDHTDTLSIGEAPPQNKVQQTWLDDARRCAQNDAHNQQLPHGQDPEGSDQLQGQGYPLQSSLRGHHLRTYSGYGDSDNEASNAGSCGVQLDDPSGEESNAAVRGTPPTPTSPLTLLTDVTNTYPISVEQTAEDENPHLLLIKQNVGCESFCDITRFAHRVEHEPNMTQMLSHLGSDIVQHLVQWAQRLPFFTQIPMSAHLHILTSKWHEVLFLTTTAYQTIIDTRRNKPPVSRLNPEYFKRKLSHNFHRLHSYMTRRLRQSITLQQLKTEVSRLMEAVTAVILNFSRLQVTLPEYACLKVILLLNLVGDECTPVTSAIQQQYMTALEEHTAIHHPTTANRYGELILLLAQVQSAASLLLQSRMIFVPFLLSNLAREHQLEAK